MVLDEQNQRIGDLFLLKTVPLPLRVQYTMKCHQSGEFKIPNGIVP